MKVKLNKENKDAIRDYGDLFSDTGGNDITELLEREGVNVHNNLVVSCLQISVAAQLGLILRLKKRGLLLPVKA